MNTLARERAVLNARGLQVGERKAVLRLQIA